VQFHLFTLPLGESDAVAAGEGTEIPLSIQPTLPDGSFLAFDPPRGESAVERLCKTNIRKPQVIFSRQRDVPVHVAIREISWSPRIGMLTLENTG